MQKYLFIDRDGTLICSPPPGGQVDTLDKLELYPGITIWLKKIADECDFKFVMVTNQNGLGTDKLPYATFLPPQQKMLDDFEKAGIQFSDIIIDDSMPEDNSPNRKPRIGRMNDYLRNPENDIPNSFVVGDRLTDVQFAKNLGCMAILMHPDNVRGIAELTDSAEYLKNYCVAIATTSWEDVYHFLKNK